MNHGPECEASLIRRSLPCQTCAALLVLAAGLGLGAEAGAKEARSGRGVLVAKIEDGGGAPHMHPERLRGLPGEVSVFDREGNLVARRRVRSGQVARFVLPDGRYRLNEGRELHYPSPIDGCGPVRATVRQGRTIRVVVFMNCGVP